MQRFLASLKVFLFSQSLFTKKQREGEWQKSEEVETTTKKKWKRQKKDIKNL